MSEKPKATVYEIEQREPDRPPAVLGAVELGNVMAAEIAPPAFVVYPLIPRGLVTLLGGHGGAGKSVLALTLAAHVAAGRDWAGFPVESGRVLYVSLEDGAELIRFRLRRIVQAYGLDPRAIADGLRVADGSESDTPLATEHADLGIRRLGMTHVLEELAELSEGAGLVIVDNASDAFGGNENDRQQVRTFVRGMLGRIARATGAGLVLLAHLDKQAARFGANGNSYSGSTAWHNSTRSRLALLVSEDSPELRHEKNNVGPMAAPLRLNWTDTGVLMPATGSDAERPGEVSAQQKADDVAILGAIRAAIAAGVDIPTARTGPATTLHVLATFPDLPAGLCAKGAARRFWSAVSRLERDGLIERQEYRNAYRKQRERYTVPLRADRIGAEGGNADLLDLPEGCAERARAHTPFNPHAHMGAHGCAVAPMPPRQLPAHAEQTGANRDRDVAAYRRAKDGE
jgi:hypothetical protein